MTRLHYAARKLQAIACLMLGRDAAALAVFDALVHRWHDAPGASDAHDRGYALASRAHLLAQAGRMDEALRDARRVVAVRPDDAGSWFNCGFLLEATGCDDEALHAFTRAATLAPRLDRAWYGQALVLMRLRRYPEALQALQRNTELQPMSPHGWSQLARLHLACQRPREALKVIQHLRGFEPAVAAQLEQEAGSFAGPGR